MFSLSFSAEIYYRCKAYESYGSKLRCQAPQSTVQGAYSAIEVYLRLVFTATDVAVLSI